MPGEFRTLTPNLRANPDRGLICPSKPCGIAIENPVGMKLYSPDLIIIYLTMAADKSMPALFLVKYLGADNPFP